MASQIQQNKGKPRFHIVKGKQGQYLELRSGERSLYLGHFHADRPASLLEKVLEVAADCDMPNLYLLLRADKSSYLGERPRGRPPRSMQQAGEKSGQEQTGPDNQGQSGE